MMRTGTNGSTGCGGRSRRTVGVCTAPCPSWNEAFTNHYSRSDPKCCRTPTVTFKLHNKTGWASATKLPFRTSLRSDESGAVYEQYISWSENLKF